MSVKAEKKYNGTVAPGSGLYETQNGNIGYQVMLGCEDGETSFTIWLTEKNRERAKRYFEALGVDIAKLQSQSYINYQLGLDITGKEVSFGTKEEEYNGKTSIKVSWIGKRSVSGPLSGAAAQFFGGTSEAVPAVEDPITDDDIPF